MVTIMIFWEHFWLSKLISMVLWTLQSTMSLEYLHKYIKIGCIQYSFHIMHTHASLVHHHSTSLSTCGVFTIITFHIPFTQITYHEFSYPRRVVNCFFLENTPTSNTLFLSTSCYKFCLISWNFKRIWLIGKQCHIKLFKIIYMT